jgi:hypothetical protein
MGYQFIIKVYNTNSDWLAGKYHKMIAVTGSEAWAIVEGRRYLSYDNYEVVEIHKSPTETIRILR